MTQLANFEQHRHFFVLPCAREDSLRHFQQLTKHLANPLLVTAQPDCFPPHTLMTVPPNKVHSLLGSNQEAILFDIHDGIAVNALGAAAGMVKGGGIFAITLPESGWEGLPDLESERFLPWPLTADQVISHYKPHFLYHLGRSEARWQIPNGALPAITSINTIKLNEQQVFCLQQLQDFLADQSATAIVLTAHRGRGKSTLLGTLLAEQSHSQRRIGVTAPNKQATQQIQSRFLEYDAGTGQSFPFFSPDELIHTPQPLDCLIVDEAAAIPVPMLEKLLAQYPKLIFATTSHGYEGMGKGFGIRFRNTLAQLPTKVSWLTLNTPVRWAPDDPLENFVDQLLMINTQNEAPLSASGALSICCRTGGDWQPGDPLLSQAFLLLVNAHYQTTPEDFRWILDDPSVSLWLSHSDTMPLSTAVVTEEGPIADDMAYAVLAGQRRPRGHLLPQSLLAHEGLVDAGQFRYWRISRIATQPHKQRQGQASALLQEMVQTGRHAGVDFLCTSFAASDDVVPFWQKNGFISVRLGTARDQASGSYSMMLVKPLNPTALAACRDWHHRYLENLRCNLTTCYGDLTPQLAIQLAHSSMLNDSDAPIDDPDYIRDVEDLRLFVNAHRPLASVRAQLSRYLYLLIRQARLEPDQAMHQLLFEVMTKPMDRIDFAHYGLHSKKMVERGIKDTLRPLLD